MEHFYFFDFTRKRRFLYLGILGFFVVGLIMLQINFGVLGANSSEEVALTKGNGDEPNIALTFNISWGEERVHDILERLNEEDVQATFFLSGEWAERHPTIVEKIAENNHEIGMLGYRYKSYLDQELEEVRRDLFLAEEVFGKLGHDDVQLLRAPNGHFNEEIVELAQSMGFEVVHWNVNPNDWENPGAEYIVDTVMESTSNGDILLLHASDAVKHTSEALETILPGLKNKGFTFVPISALISEASTDIELVD